jgi:hypothetical protein
VLDQAPVDGGFKFDPGLVVHGRFLSMRQCRAMQPRYPQQ